MNVRIFTSIAVLSTLALSACGSDSPPAAGPASVSAATPAAAAAFNEADVQFAQGMIPHHQQAVQMADLALDSARGVGTEVTELATRIKAAQDPEIILMSDWLTTWGQPAPTKTTGDDMAMGGDDMATGDGMMSAAAMKSLAAVKGPEFDKLWLEMMIAHHEGAVKMAKAEKLNGSSKDAMGLADKIITAQMAEIAEMTTALSG